MVVQYHDYQTNYFNTYHVAGMCRRQAHGSKMSLFFLQKCKKNLKSRDYKSGPEDDRDFYYI